jgi:hypothetical protein
MHINHHGTGTTNADAAQVPYPYDLGTAPGEWHVITVAVCPDAVRYYLDGDLFLTATRDLPIGPHRPVLQIESIIGGNAPDFIPPPPDAQQGHVQFDWVTVHADDGTDKSTTYASTFTGANGTAPTGWVGVRGTNTVQANRLQQVSPATAFGSALVRRGIRFTDGTITARVNMPALVHQWVGFRWNPATDSGYVVNLNGGGGTIRLGRWVNAGLTTLATAPFTFTAGVDYWVKVQQSAGGIKARVWAATDAEPTTWTIAEVFDFTYAAGDVVLMTQAGAAGTAVTGTWDDVTIVDKLV